MKRKERKKQTNKKTRERERETRERERENKNKQKTQNNLKIADTFKIERALWYDLSVECTLKSKQSQPSPPTESYGYAR